MNSFEIEEYIKNLVSHKSVSLIGGDPVLRKLILNNIKENLNKELPSIYFRPIIHVHFKKSSLKDLSIDEILSMLFNEFLFFMNHYSKGISTKEKTVQISSFNEFIISFNSIIEESKINRRPYILFIIEEFDYIYTGHPGGLPSLFRATVDFFKDERIGSLLFLGYRFLWNCTKESDIGRSPLNNTEDYYIKPLKISKFKDYTSQIVDFDISDELLSHLYSKTFGNCLLTEKSLSCLNGRHKVENDNIRDAIDDITIFKNQNYLDMQYNMVNEVERKILKKLLFLDGITVDKTSLEPFFRLDKYLNGLLVLEFLGFIRVENQEIFLGTGVIRDFLQEKILEISHLSDSEFNNLSSLLNDQFTTEITKYYGIQAVESYLAGSFIGSGILLGIALEHAISDLARVLIDFLEPKNLSFNPKLANKKTPEDWYTLLQSIYEREKKNILSKLRIVNQSKHKEIPIDKIERIIKVPPFGISKDAVLKRLRDELVHPIKSSFNPLFPGEDEMRNYLQTFRYILIDIRIIKKYLS